MRLALDIITGLFTYNSCLYLFSAYFWRMKKKERFKSSTCEEVQFIRIFINFMHRIGGWNSDINLMASMDDNWTLSVIFHHFSRHSLIYASFSILFVLLWENCGGSVDKWWMGAGWLWMNILKNLKNSKKSRNLW